MKVLEKIKEICDGIEYSRHIPKEAEELARQHNIVIIVGGSDDLMYCYGAKSYLTEYCEHGEGWDGCDLAKDASEEQLQKEAKQLGLKIFWCGTIAETGETIKDYDTNKSGAFSYTVNDNIEALDFKVLERGDANDVYCTGKIIQLPNNFRIYP